MKKFVVIILCLFSSLSIANQNQEATENPEISGVLNNAYYKIKVNKEYNEIVKLAGDEIEKDKVLKTMAVIFSGIDNIDEYSDYKKYLLKINALYFLKSSFISYDDSLMLEFAKETMPINICTSYQFGKNTKKALTEIINLTLYDDERKVGFNKASLFLNSKKIMDKYRYFMEHKKKNIPNLCRG